MLQLKSEVCRGVSREHALGDCWPVSSSTKYAMWFAVAGKVSTHPSVAAWLAQPGAGRKVCAFLNRIRRVLVCESQ